MTPKSRSYYDLESFWSNGTPVPLDNVLTPNVVTKEEPVEEEVVSDQTKHANICETL